MGECYRVGKSIIAVRCAAPPSGNAPVHALIDDDIPSMLMDPGLPPDYRHRLQQAWQVSVLARDTDRVRSFLVPSRALEDIYMPSGIPVIRINPTWPIPAEFPLHDFLVPQLQVGFLGTRSHIKDLELLRDALSDGQRNWIFHHFLGTVVPGWLAALPNIIAHKPLSWHSYRRHIHRMRFHLCVYPTQDTPTNAARSCNKIMEHSMTGAASLFSDTVPFADQIHAFVPSLLVSPSQWPDKMRELSSDRKYCMELAQKCHQFAFHVSHEARERQKIIWDVIARGELPPDAMRCR